MALYPEARRALEQAAADPGPRVHEPGYDVAATRERDRAEALAGPRDPVADVRDLDADGVPVRWYAPTPAQAAEPRGLVVHLHGGGFVLNDVEVHDAAARRLALSAGTPVLSVEYRRPPEHPFPAAPDDVDRVLAWLDAGAGEGGAPALGQAGPVAVHGDSAGGNLALVAALRHPGRFAAVVLVYPFLDPEMAGESYRTAADGFDPAEARWYWEQYAGSEADLRHPDLAPLLSDRLHTLPPTLVLTAEHDPLRDEGELLAARLADLGVAVTGVRHLGQVHGFWRHVDTYPAAWAVVAQTAGFLAAHGLRG